MYLTIEDLVSNALIELVENDVSRIVSYPTILEYGNSIVEELGKVGINAVLLLHRDKTVQFEEEYKELFDFFEIEGIRYVKLKENIDTKNLRKHFRVPLPLQVLIALTMSRKVLGIDAKVKSKGKKTVNF